MAKKKVDENAQVKKAVKKAVKKTVLYNVGLLTKYDNS